MLPYYIMCIHSLSACDEVVEELIDTNLTLLKLFANFIALFLNFGGFFIDHNSQLSGLIFLLVLFDSLEVVFEGLSFFSVELHNSVVFFHLFRECLHLGDLFLGNVVGLLRNAVTFLVEAVDFGLIENEILEEGFVIQHLFQCMDTLRLPGFICCQILKDFVDIRMMYEVLQLDVYTTVELS